MSKQFRTVPEYDLNPYLTEADILAFGRGLQAAAPELFRMEELGRSREGRPITLFSLTDFSTGKPENKPAFYLQGMVHCHELGSLTATLFFARELIARHQHGGLLEKVAFYIVPRINPDGAEAVRARGGYIRSRRDDSDRSRPNTWMEEDMDGNSLILEMRIPDPCGRWVVSPEDPRVMLPREIDSDGPFYTLMQEGLFHQYDGSPVTRNGNTVIDMNRNYGAHWSPLQSDAGAFPHSEPEIYQVGRFFETHANIFGAVDFHNGPLQILSAPAMKGAELSGNDNAILDRMREFAAEQQLGISIASLYPSPPLHDVPGNFVDWSYFHCGILGWVIELGTIVSSVMPLEEHMKTDCARIPHASIYHWQSQHTGERPCLFPWKKFLHPQLGEVEIGGRDCAGYSVPGRAELRDYLERVFRFCCRHASMAPRLTAESVEVLRPALDFRRIRLRIFNASELPTSVTERGAMLPRRRKPYLEFRPAPGVECLSMNRGIETEHFGPYEQRYFEWFSTGPITDGILGAVVVKGGPAGEFQVEIPPSC